MIIDGPAQKVTIYVGSQDLWHGRNLAVAIVERCRELGLAGATMTRGVMGFGKHSRIHRAHLLGLSDDLPERIEVIDSPERIALILPILDEMVDGGLVLVQDVEVVHYRASRKEMTWHRLDRSTLIRGMELPLASSLSNRPTASFLSCFQSYDLGLVTTCSLV